jgi:general secretion pathway protein I
MRSERLSRDYSCGYTLVEVLVAFVILAMALTVLLRIFAGGVRNIAVSADYAKAVLIAESQLAASGIGEPLYAGETQGVEGEDFTWTRSITRYQPSPDYTSSVKNLEAWHVTVTVEWPGARGSRSIDMSTVRLTYPTGGAR